MSSRTIMIMAGGTGGHVFPGLAVADALRDRGWSVVWLGTRDGMEANLVPKHGYQIELVKFGGVRGKGPLRLVLLPLLILIACWQAAAAIFRRRPDVVLGMGGFASFPGGLMAVLLNRPLVIHEQNSIAGLTNRVLARVADRVLVAFPNAFARDGAVKSEWTGNPVRSDIAAVAAPAQRFEQRGGPLRVLVVGGSLGAQALNQTVPAALALLPADRRPIVTHQAGARNIDALRQAYADAAVDAEVLPFIDDMASRYAGADLVVCRAGALTVSELAAAGVASILVPFPHAVDDHQTHNARFLSEAGAALLVPQTQLDAASLARLLDGLDRARLLQMAEKARSLGQPEATRKVADICMESVR